MVELMENKMDYIEDLMIAKLSNDIETKDAAFLEEMIDADPEVAKLWKQHVLIASQLKNNYNKEQAWEKVHFAINKEEKKSRSFLLSLVTVVIIVLSGVLYFVNNPQKSIGKQQQTAINRTAANSIRFTTDNESISIDRNQKEMIAGKAADISLKDGALLFTAKKDIPSTTISTLEVPKGLDKKILLNDGTMVWVNAATRISFPLAFTKDTREVTLEGEAYFEVAKNKTKPFIVHTNEMDVQVLGTHFNIKAYKDEPIQASLTEGSVQAMHESQKITLTPGNAAIINGSSLGKKEFDENTVLAWMKGAYYFDNETINNIGHTINRWFGYSFVYDNSVIRDIHWSGALEKSQSLESFLDRLSSAANLSYEISGEHITLRKK